MTKAAEAYGAVYAFVDSAVQTRLKRLDNPGYWPEVPENTTQWATLQILGALLELGFEPDGWQEVYARVIGLSCHGVLMVGETCGDCGVEGWAKHEGGV